MEREKQHYPVACVDWKNAVKEFLKKTAYPMQVKSV
jgi:hypothetical protein